VFIQRGNQIARWTDVSLVDMLRRLSCVDAGRTEGSACLADFTRCLSRGRSGIGRLRFAAVLHGTFAKVRVRFLNLDPKHLPDF